MPVLAWNGREFARISGEVRDLQGNGPNQQKEPLQSHDTPTRPWAKDLDFLAITDYYSSFVEVEPLEPSLPRYAF